MIIIHIVYTDDDTQGSSNTSHMIKQLYNNEYHVAYRVGACDVTSAALNKNVRQKHVAFVWKHTMNWSCSAIGYTNRDTKEAKDKRYKVLSNTGENRREDCG